MLSVMKDLFEQENEWWHWLFRTLSEYSWKGLLIMVIMSVKIGDVLALYGNSFKYDPYNQTQTNKWKLIDMFLMFFNI